MTGVIATTLALLMTGCAKEPNTYLSPNFPEEIAGYFDAGEWTISGLVEGDGTVHLSPEPNPVTGKRLDVTEFGAKSGDSSFDNTESFQAAINAAEPGDEVYIPEGTYHLKEASLFTTSYVSHLLMKGQVNLTGAGMDKTVLVSAFDSDTNEKYKTAVIVSRSQSNMVISGFTVTSDVDDSELPDPDVSNVNSFAPGAPVYGIVIDNDKPIEKHGNVYIRDIKIEKFDRMAIRIRVVHDVIVEGCVIEKATDLGGGGAGYGISIQGMSNGSDLTGTNLDTVHNIVRNCEIKGPYIRHAILLQYYAHNNLIVNNTVSDTLLDAIDLHGEDEYSNEIAYNTVINTRRGAGIGIGNSGATHDAAGPYNFVHDNTITGGDRGIDILYGSPNSVLVNNTINDIHNEDGTAVFIQNGNGTVLRDNTIENFTGTESKGIVILYSYNALEPEKGIPDGMEIVGNTISSIAEGIYVEAHTDDYVYEDNKVKKTVGEAYVDGNDTFELPPVSDVVIPKIGTLLLPSDDNFITNEARDSVQTQANMKFKASTHDVPYNRMIYMKFDLTEAPMNKDKVYLKITGKSKDGLATINIHGSTTYTDWKETTINWTKALYHADQVAKTEDPNGELDHVTDFTFTTVGTEFNSYYIDVTDYIKGLDSKYVTLILSNDAVENMYCEIYSKENSAQENQPGLIFSDGDS